MPPDDDCVCCCGFGVCGLSVLVRVGGVGVAVGEAIGFALPV